MAEINNSTLTGGNVWFYRDKEITGMEAIVIIENSSLKF